MKTITMMNGDVYTEVQIKEEIQRRLAERFPANGGKFSASLLKRVYRNVVKTGSFSQAINLE